VIGKRLRYLDQPLGVALLDLARDAQMQRRALGAQQPRIERIANESVLENEFVRLAVEMNEVECRHSGKLLVQAWRVSHLRQDIGTKPAADD